MTEKDLPALSIADLQSLLRRREVSARDVVDALRARIEAVDGEFRDEIDAQSVGLLARARWIERWFGGRSRRGRGLRRTGQRYWRINSPTGCAFGCCRFQTDLWPSFAIRSCRVCVVTRSNR